MDNLELDHRATRAGPSGVFESVRLGPAESQPAECATETPDAREYHPHLATTELIIEVRRLLTTERRVERLICRYLADLADRISERRERELEGFQNELDAAKVIFGLGARKTRERIRVGRALRRLPSIEHAFIAGDISYSRVREITRIAQPDTESSWLELAQSLDMRAIERQVALATPRPAEALALLGDTPGARLRAGDDCRCNDDPAGPDWDGEDAEPFAGYPERTGFDGDAHDHERAGFNGHGADAVPSGGYRDRDAWVGDGDGHDGHYVRAGFACDDADGFAANGDPAKRSHARASTEWTGRDSVRVTFELTAEAWALLERALEGARRRCGGAHADATAFDDGKALEAIARDALSFQNANHEEGAGEVDSADPRRLLHDGEPAVTGDAEGVLCISATNGSPLADAPSQPPASSLTHDPEKLPHAVGPDSVSRATQGGSSTTTRLLQIIGRRGGWTIDDLIEQSGLHIAEVQHALLELQLQERIRHRGYRIDPS